MWNKCNIESFAHKHAKEHLVEWLRNGPLEEIVYTNGTEWLTWTVCKQKENCFYALEYPFYYAKNGKLKLSYYNGDCPCGCKEDWCYSQCGYKVEMNYKFVNVKPVLIADIAEGHEGSIATVIEIKHTNETPKWKLNLILKSNVNFIEVDCMEVLKQINEPKRLYADKMMF